MRCGFVHGAVLTQNKNLAFIGGRSVRPFFISSNGW